MIREDVNRLTVLSLMLFVLALAGCGGKEAVSPEDFEQQAFDDLRAEMADVIVDPERRAIMSGLADVLQRDFAELRIAVTVRRTELRKLNANYDATREQFSEYIEKHDARIRASRERVTATHQSLVRATTVQEWDALQKADTKAMKELVSSLQSI